MQRIGFSQVEPNHMSGMVTGQIFAQLPVDATDMGKVIENGRFVVPGTEELNRPLSQRKILHKSTSTQKKCMLE